MWYKIILYLGLLLAFKASALPLARQEVPEPLSPWVDWVLYDQYDYQCPFSYSNYRQKLCTWPSRLELELNSTQGAFSMQWKIYAPSWVSLPGDARNWPQKVKVNNKSAVVLLKQGRPSVFLKPGTYHIEGSLYWDFMPEALAIPDNTGLLKLHINGQKIPFPFIKQGRLWLNRSGQDLKAKRNKQDRLEIQVFRKIIDGVPLRILTQMELNVSGIQRELNLPMAMPDGFLPLSLNSPIPARLEQGNRLLLQVRPGRWHIEFMSRSTRALDRLPFNSRSNVWPESEIWVFEAKPHIRVVEVQGVQAVDPQRTNLPASWRQLPAYRINNGQSMVFNVIRQGDPQPEPNALNIKRRLWLDFDGDGFTVNDQISGKMSHGWRLDVMPEMQPGRVSLDGRDQLITQLQGSDQQGIEVRQGRLQLSADSRIEGSIGNLSATGWRQTFKQVSAELNLPPGWRLFAAGGVDNVPQSWVSRWTLLDLFIVLIVALAIARMWNWQWGLLVLAGLALLWHEPGAPRFIWLNLTAVWALLRVLPHGRFYKAVKIYRNLSYALLILIAIPFMVDQVRFALYPQLQKPWQAITGTNYQSGSDQLSQIASAPVAVMEEMAIDKSKKARALAKKPSRPLASREPVQAVNFNRIDPNASIQTGPGLPQWQWQMVNLSWNGPVDQDQEISFWFISPFFSVFLNIIRVVVVIAFSMFMFGLIDGNFRWVKPNSAFLSILLLVPVLFYIPQSTAAGFPEQQLLNELQKRLLKAPECLPGCVEVESMQIDIDQKRLHLTQVIHASAKIAVPLPAKMQDWYPEQVLIDNNSAKGLFRGLNGDLMVALAAGPHKLELIGRIPSRSDFVVSLPLAVHRATVTASEGWQIDGLHEHGQVDKQLQFTRSNLQPEDPAQNINIQGAKLPQFFQLQRTLQLSLDWQIENRLSRLSSSDHPAVVEIPLLEGEAVISSNVRLQNGKVLVNLAAGQRNIVWRSLLQKSESIHLQAMETDHWVEVWRADVSPIWHVDLSGIAMVHHQDKQGRWLPEWRPWPGQTVTLTITRPAAVAGQTLTVDNTRVIVKPGKRNREVTLSMLLRSSRGTQHTISLPDMAVLQTVKIDSKTQPIRQKQNQVTLPIKPGSQQVELNWLSDNGISTLVSTPEVDLGVASVNSHITMQLGQDRWVLFAFGPRFGPAVLFWGVLVVIAVIAYGLGHITLTPLQHWQWLLLLIGLSQVELTAACIVVAWLMLLGLRRHYPLQQSGYFNAAQVGLGVLTGLSMVILYIAVQQGLLGAPQMQITGNQSSATQLQWYQDHSVAILPSATVLSLPVYVYRLLMLAWSLWLAASLLSWLKWGWQCFTEQAIWKKYEAKDNNPLEVSGHEQQAKQSPDNADNS